jgi:DNA invertase Pin-like site-specific DNA recombinase
MNAWLYARVSTYSNNCNNCRKTFLDSAKSPVCPVCGSSDVQKSQDTENQMIVLRQWMASLGHTVTAVYEDRASGKTGEREQFKKMMLDIRARRPRAPIVVGFWALDRLSREGALATLKYLQDITNMGAHVKSYTEQYLDTMGPWGEAIIAFLATIAKQQRIRLAENTRAGIERARIHGTKSGKPHGRPQKFSRAEALAIFEQLKSYRGTARVLGVCQTAVRNVILGRQEEVPTTIEWSDPVWGRLVDGLFVEAVDGRTVVRYDLGTQQAHCLNHQQLLSLCRHLHTLDE